MRIQQVGLKDKAKCIAGKQALQTQSAETKEQEAKQLDLVSQIQVDNQSSSTNFLSDEIQKTQETINQMKNFCSNSLNGMQIEQKIVLSEDKSQVLDIMLVRPGKNAMKRSMKRYLKKRAQQKLIMPNLFNARQNFMDLLLIKFDYIEYKPSHEILIDNLFSQAESIFLQGELVESHLTQRQKQKQEMAMIIQTKNENISKPQLKCTVSAQILFQGDGLTKAEKETMLDKKCQGQFASKRVSNHKLYEKQSELNFNERQLQEQEIEINIEKTVENLSKLQGSSLFSAHECIEDDFSRAQTAFMLYKRQYECQAAKSMKNQNLYEQQYRLQSNEIQILESEIMQMKERKKIDKTIQNLQKLQGQFSFLDQELCKETRLSRAQKEFMLYKVQYAWLSVRGIENQKLFEKQYGLNSNVTHTQEQEMMINTNKRIVKLSKTQSSLSAQQLYKIAGFTNYQKVYMLHQEQLGLLTAKGEYNLKIYENQSELQFGEVICLKYESLYTQFLKKQLSLQDQQNLSMAYQFWKASDKNSYNEKQQNDYCQKIVNKEQEINTKIKKTIENLSKPQDQFSFSVQELCKMAGSGIAEKIFMLQKKQLGIFAAKIAKNSRLNVNQPQIHVNKWQLQEQDMMIDIKKINEHLIKPQNSFSFSVQELCKAVGQTMPKKVFIPYDKYQQLLTVKGVKNSKDYEKQYELHVEELRCSKHKTQVFNQQLNSENRHNGHYGSIANQQNSEKVSEQSFIVGNQSQLYEYLSLILSKKKNSQQKQIQKDHLNIQLLQQQLTFQNKLNMNQLQISNMKILINLTQAQRNILLNLIKQNKISQIQTLIVKIILKQHQLLKQNTLETNVLLTHNNTPQFQENKVNLAKKNNISQKLQSKKTWPVKQLSRFNQHAPVFVANYSKILNEHKLLGGGCGTSKVVFESNVLKEEDQQKLKSDKFFNESKYANESQFKDFIEIYDKYYKNNEINLEDEHENEDSVLENRIRTIVEALHKQCEHIFSLTIRSKVIELINLLINYYMIVIQKNNTQSLQKFIDKIDQKLKDLKETCFQNRKKYPCLDLCQYFDLLISLNSQRVGIDKLNQSQFIIIAKIILKLVKLGAGFTSIFGAFDNLSNLDKFKNDFKEMLSAFSQLFQEIGQQTFESFTSYSRGNLSNKIQAIWLRKVKSLGDDLGDEHQQIIFYLKEINEIYKSGNNEIVLFVYMQLNYLLQKKQKDDNLSSFTQLLIDNKYENLILEFINDLQLKTYSTTLFENVKKLLDSLITSEQFRQLKISLLLKFSHILENFNDKKQKYNELMIHLCMTYLQENEISVKIIYKGNQQMKKFIQDIEKYTVEIVNESKQAYQTMKSMIQDEEQLNKIANKIESQEDVAILLAKTYVQMWEASVKQRQEQKQIAHKDDALLEVIQLYINQKVTHLQGYSLFENLNHKNEDNQLELSDAIRLIINQFLIPNFVQPKDKNQTSVSNKSNQQTCKILSVLAEGGSGKSMILKKLEFELLKDDSQYIKDERAQYIPFIVKCNSLDIMQPSIEEYLLSQNLSQSKIELLKRSERNKLIMLDGYDEYAGDYFKVYQKLKINNWVNTLVIVTSRLEKISVSDAKIYFNYYDKQGNQGSQDSFSILKLEKINDSDIKKYLESYKKQQKNQPSFNEQKHNKFQEIIFESKARQFLEMLKLPINLYLTTRMVADLDLNDQKTLTTIQEASDQVEIQELFFQQQFLKLSQNFVEQKLKISTKNTIERDNKKQELIGVVQSCYFEYFQTIAMLMFLQKGKKANFLATKKSEIRFKLRDEVTKYFNQNKINNEDIIKNVKGYIDSRVITRIQLSIKEENSQNQSADNNLNDETLEFEFRHKSLFEYFTARAMKYDFDLHKETIFKLNSSQLREFSINQRIIMSSEVNASEQQILLKLFKLIKPCIDSPQFKENYYLEDISKTNRYIQFLKKSDIKDCTQTSEIDVGSSNLLSTLFISNFSFPNLIFKKCSFSKAYIQKHSRKVVEFQDCNLENAFLQNQHLEYFETSNTKNVTQTAFQQKFNTDDIYSFNHLIFYKNNLVTITKTGFINLFEPDENQTFKKVLSNKITLASLKTIHLNENKNLFVVTAQKSIIQVNPINLEKVNSFTFSNTIASLSINKSEYIVTLSNQQILKGDVENGFKPLDKSRIQSYYTLSNDNFIVTSLGNQTDIYNLQDLKIVKINIDPKCNLNISAFSANGKYLATGSKDNTCKIWNVDKGFELINTIQGHTKPIQSVAFSADGKYLATGSGDNTCKIWNVDKGFELINTIQGHTYHVNSVAFSADGKYLATGSGDNTCKIWNVDKGFELINTIQGHTFHVNSVAFSADGKYLATGSGDNTCKIWNVDKGFELINTIQGHTSFVKSVAFSADGKYLATGSWDNTCKIWNVDKGFELINTIQGHTKPIYSVAFSADGKYLATGSWDKTCIIWNVDKGFELINTIQGHTNSINSVAFSADGKYLATGSEDNTCKIWNVDKGFELINTIQGHTNSINSVAFSADGKYLATGSWDNTCKIWNVDKGFELINTIQGHTKPIYSVAFSADGKYLATGSWDNTCKIWNVDKGFELINTIQGHTNSINSVAFSADGKYLATGSEDNTCKIWNVDKGFELINTIQGHTKPIQSVAFSADGKYLATGLEDNTCKIWNVDKGFELINTIQGHTNSINSVAFSADGKYLATGSGDNTCKIWNVDKGFELINTIQGHTYHVNSVAFSADGKYLATSSEDNTCKIWNVDKGFELINTIQGHTNSINSVAFSAEGKYLATGSFNYTCKIWNVDKGFDLINTIQGHTDFINSVAFSADGKYLATGSWDNTCKIWNVDKGFELINTIQGHTKPIYSVAFSADGKYLATGSWDNTCKIWNVDKGFELINTIQGHTNSIKSVAFSTDGKYLATGSWDNTCKIWNVDKGLELINTIQGHTSRVNSVAFSADGKYLSTGSWDNTCKIWNDNKFGEKIGLKMESDIAKINCYDNIINKNNINNLVEIIKSEKIFPQLYEL